MKIVALALANIALAQETLHGGAGDHSFFYKTIEGPEEVSVQTSIEDGTMTISDVSPIDDSPQMFYREEQARTVHNFDGYQGTRSELLEMFGGNAIPDLSELVLQQAGLPDLGNVDSGAVITAQSVDGSTFLTVFQSATIENLQCTDFLRSDKTGTLTMVLSDDDMGTTLTVSDAQLTDSAQVGNYIHTLSKKLSGPGDDAVNCGFTYTIKRLAYTLSFCEQTSDVGADCLRPVPGFDKIDDVELQAVTNTYTVNGYSQGEMTVMATGQPVTHSVFAVLPPTVTITAHNGTSTISETMTLHCNAMLTVQADCKFNELCWFKFYVGPCNMNQWTNPGDADINVEPYSLANHAFPDTMTANNFVAPANAPGLGSADHLTALGQVTSYKNQTAMNLQLMDGTGDDDIEVTSYAGVTLHGPAMYKADTELNGKNAYEIIGYMKFDEATLNNSNNTQLKSLLAIPDDLKIIATSYVRGKFNEGSS